MLTGGLALLGICTAIFGTSFLEQTFLVGSQPHSLHAGGNLLYYCALSMPVIIVFGLAYIVFRVKGKRVDLFSIYLPLTLIICLCLIFKQGAWLNYFMEFVAASSIAIGLLLGALLNRRTHKCLWQFLFISLVVMLPLGGIVRYGGGITSGTEEAYRVIRPQIESTLSPVICEDATLLMEAGKFPVWEPSVFVLGGYYKTTWNQTPFVREIESKSFGLIVLNYNVSTWWEDQRGLSYPVPQERLTEEMATAIVSSYHLDYNVSNYWVYIPNW